MNRNTVSYHIKRMQTNGLVERLERNGLRLASTGDDHGEGLQHAIANPMASRIDVALDGAVSSPPGTVVEASGEAQGKPQEHVLRI
jgi:Mn-dependent DtxR family transcriptional regulator